MCVCPHRKLLNTTHLRSRLDGSTQFLNELNASSILEERVGEYFKVDASVPFMEKVFKVRHEKREQIPVVNKGIGMKVIQTAIPEVLVFEHLQRSGQL